MLLKEQIVEVYNYQCDYVNEIDVGTFRAIKDSINIDESHVKILTGIRRSGKSTVMLQLAKECKQYNFFSFEDPRLSNFDVNDFFKLEKIFEETGGSDLFLFDEIQNVEGWEQYVRVLHDKKKRVVVTGSNARILSKELGTSLTGRQISYEVFPFSYKEFLLHKKLDSGLESFKEYLLGGGMPEYLNSGNREVHASLYNDLVYRDIVVRYGLRNPKVVKELGVFLATNSGKEFSYSSLAKTFELGSFNTAISYVSYFEDAYMFFPIPRFSFSLKQQAKNPKKIYCIDTGFAANLSMSFSPDCGRLQENLVFVELKRRGFEINYFRDKGECDFVALKDRKVKLVVQVCYNLTPENMKRELNGVVEAINETGLDEGFVLTHEQEDCFEQDGKKINVFPVWKWLLGDRV